MREQENFKIRINGACTKQCYQGRCFPAAVCGCAGYVLGMMQENVSVGLGVHFGIISKWIVTLER